MPPFFFMLIKYTDWYDTLTVRVPELNFSGYFQRNVWKNVPDIVAKELLKMSHFICEEDIKFDGTMPTTPGHFGLNRFGALGDLIMLIPVVRYLRRTTQHRFTLITSPRYIQTFKPFPDFVDVISSSAMDKSKFDKVLYLDGVLENDHSLTSGERLKHRIHIFEEFFKIKIDKYDFSFPISPDAEKYITRFIQC